jgi:glc operon protein GlcG
MKTDDAKRVLEAARAKAAEIAKPVSVAIVDASGAMVVFERINDAPPFTAIVAEGKAAGSAFTGRDSAMLATMGQNNPAILGLIGARLGGQRFAPAQGAVPLRDASGLIGAIGVSGATSEEDEQIARAGAAILAP